MLGIEELDRLNEEIVALNNGVLDFDTIEQLSNHLVLTNKLNEEGEDDFIVFPLDILTAYEKYISYTRRVNPDLKSFEDFFEDDCQ